MSAEVVDICDFWQQAADASDEIARRLADVPADLNGYQLTEESGAGLRQAAALLQQALALLRRAAAREARPYSKYMERVDADGGAP